MWRPFRNTLWAGIPAVLAGLGPVALPATARGGTNLVSIDTPDAYVPEREQAFWVFETLSPQIPLVLTEPAAAPASVGFVTMGTPGLGTVSFPTGAQSGNAAIGVQTIPPTEFYPGWGARWSYIALTGTTGGLEHGTPSVMLMIQAAPLPGPGPRPGLGDCYLCFWSLLLCRFELAPCDGWCVPPAAGSGAPRGGSDTEVYARYRDEVLAATATGQFYIDLYAQHGADAIVASLAEPAHVVKFLHAWVAWTPAVRALVDGNGGSVSVSAQMQADLLALLDILETNGSPALAQAVATERTRLQLDSIAGLTLAEFQTQVETLGGTSALEPVSWGRLKAQYR